MKLRRTPPLRVRPCPAARRLLPLVACLLSLSACRPAPVRDDPSGPAATVKIAPPLDATCGAFLARHCAFAEMTDAVPSPDGRYVAVLSRGEGHPVVEVVDRPAAESGTGYRVLTEVDPYPGWISIVGWDGDVLRVESDMLLSVLDGDRRPASGALEVLRFSSGVFAVRMPSGRIGAQDAALRDPVRYYARVLSRPEATDQERDICLGALATLHRIGYADALPALREALAAERDPARCADLQEQLNALDEVWTFDNLARLGDRPVTVLGNPRVADSPFGPAIAFDGDGDALLIDAHPLEGARAFTIQILFRPDEGGLPEQRFLHLQEDGTNDRILLETRLPGGGKWFYDTFLLSRGTNEALFAKDHLHPLGRWHRLASVCDGKELRHYVDGVLEMAKPAPLTPPGVGKTSVGVRINRVHWFKGAIREIRFARRALGVEELGR